MPTTARMKEDPSFKEVKYSEDVRERLNVVCDKLYGDNKAEMARALGVDRTVLTRILNGNTKRIDPAILHGLAEKGVQKEWLVSGRGEMSSNDGTEFETKTRTQETPPSEMVRTLPDEQLARQGLARVYKLDIEVSAGNGTEVHFEKVDGAEILPEWYIRQKYGVSPERLRIVKVRGDSMKPTLYPGEEVKVALWDGDVLRAGCVYVLYGPHGLIVKRLDFEDVREDEELKHIIWIKSDNPESATYNITVDEFEREYQVLASVLELHRSM